MRTVLGREACQDPVSYVLREKISDRYRANSSLPVKSQLFYGNISGDISEKSKGLVKTNFTNFLPGTSEKVLNFSKHK
jgi:hypothetical protein